MIKTKVAYLSKEIVVEEDEPSTIEELVQLVGEEGIVTHTNANLRYRNKYPRVYKRVSTELEKEGFKRLPEHKEETTHIRAVWTADGGANQGMIRALVQKFALEEPLFVRGERIAGGRVAQGALDAAHRYFAEGPTKVEEVVQTIESMLPTYRVSRSPEITPETLARGIQTLQRHLMSKAKAVTNNL